jgi:hypothetical protein
VGELSGSPLAGKATEEVLSHAPHIAVLLAANEARVKATQSPTVHKVLSHVPGTPDYDYRHGY